MHGPLRAAERDNRLGALRLPPYATMPEPQIRPYERADWPAVWALLEPVFLASETFPPDLAISDSEAEQLYLDALVMFQGLVEMPIP